MATKSNISHQLYQIVLGISNVNQAQHACISLTLDKGFLSLFKCDLWVTCGVVSFFLSSLCKDHFVEQSNAFKERKADQKTKNMSKREENLYYRLGFCEKKILNYFNHQVCFSKENPPSTYKAAVYVLYVDNLPSNIENGFHSANHLRI